VRSFGKRGAWSSSGGIGQSLFFQPGARPGGCGANEIGAEWVLKATKWTVSTTVTRRKITGERYDQISYGDALVKHSDDGLDRFFALHGQQDAIIVFRTCFTSASP